MFSNLLIENDYKIFAKYFSINNFFATGSISGIIDSQNGFYKVFRYVHCTYDW